AIARTLTTELSASQAQGVEQWLAQMEARLQSAANDTELMQQFGAAAPDLVTATADVQRAFPEATSVRLITLGPLGIASVDNRQAGLHNNIEADLLRRVSSGAPAQPEAYQLDKRWVISFAQAVVAPGARYAAGAILLTVPAQTLEQSLTAQLAARGEAQLQQLAGTQGIRFAAAGSGDEPAHAVA